MPNGKFPALAPLLRHPRSKRLLRRPYLVDLMVRSQAAPGVDEALGEEDIITVVHEKVVRRSDGALPGQGSAHDRDVAWSRLAEAVIDGPGSSRLDTFLIPPGCRKALSLPDDLRMAAWRAPGFAPPPARDTAR